MTDNTALPTDTKTKSQAPMQPNMGLALRAEMEAVKAAQASMRPRIKFALSVHCDYDNKAVRKIYAATFAETFPEEVELSTGEIFLTAYKFSTLFQEQANVAEAAGEDKRADFLKGIFILQESVRKLRHRFGEAEIKLYDEEPIANVGTAPEYDDPDFEQKFAKTLNKRYRAACRNPNLLDDEVAGVKNPEQYLGPLSYIKALKTPAFKFDPQPATSEI